MGLFDKFLPQQTPVPVTPEAQVPPNQGNIPAAPTTVIEPLNPTAPITPAPEAKEPDSPLAPFEDLWSNTAKPEGTETAAPTEMTQEAIAKVMEGANFSNIMTPELQAKVEAGGADAATAMEAMLNSLGRQALTQSTMISNKLTANAIKEALAAQALTIPDLVRAQSAKNHLIESNPVFSNPAVKPLVDAAQAQFLQKNPNATQSDLTNMTQDLMTAMAETFGPKVTPANEVAGDINWEKFLDPEQ